MPFVSVQSIYGEFTANGIVGLAPGLSDKSYVEQLFKQGQIEKRIVGLNYEDPTDKAVQSAVTFGYIDYGEMEKGEEGLYKYSNVGVDTWSLLMDSVQYGDTILSLGDMQNSVDK